VKHTPAKHRDWALYNEAVTALCAWAEVQAPPLLSLHSMSLPSLQILSVSAVAVGLRHAVALYQKDTGIQCTVQYQTSTQMRGLDWQSHAWDVVITSQALATALSSQGALEPSTSVELGGVGVGMVVHESVELPPPTNTIAFTQTLEVASTVVYNRASSGLYFEALFERLGLLSTMAHKTLRVIDGETLLKTIAQAPQDKTLVIGLGAVSEILEVEGWGIKLVGELPSEIQHVTAYLAMATAQSAGKLEVQAFLRSLTDPRIKAILHTSGVRP